MIVFSPAQGMLYRTTYFLTFYRFEFPFVATPQGIRRGAVDLIGQQHYGLSPLSQESAYVFILLPLVLAMSGVSNQKALACFDKNNLDIARTAVLFV
ncbi:MAG: hypothetical protein U0U46_06550 [Saprospiraceae bacterium]|nr:hypothetical protein [Saprospiraceae bacterium]